MPLVPGSPPRGLCALGGGVKRNPWKDRSKDARVLGGCGEPNAVRHPRQTAPKPFAVLRIEVTILLCYDYSKGRPVIA
jgi:hypothetical protein